MKYDVFERGQITDMIEVLQSKIHRATVTEANLNYEGSITISDSIIKKAGIVEYQKVLIVDVNNGNRFETYVIGTDNENVICVNGAAARLVSVGDKIIIMSFCYMELVDNKYKPNIILLDKNNQEINYDNKYLEKNQTT